MSFTGKFRKWLLQETDESRRAPRSTDPEVVVYYWDGSAPEGRHIRDISVSGAFILTPERWYPGTIVRIILQGYPTVVKADGSASVVSSISIPARVVRDEKDGVAVEFVFPDKKEEEAFKTFLAGIPAQPVKAWSANVIPMDARSRKDGQALIEFALLIPLVFLLAVNAVNFGGFMYAWITVANAARDGAQYMAMSSASPGGPTAATPTQITALVTADVSSLIIVAVDCSINPKPQTLCVTVCSNSTQTQTCAPPDPEPNNGYTVGAVDVTYTYQPFIPLFSFPQLNIYATIPPTKIHRQAVMRMMQ